MRRNQHSPDELRDGFASLGNAPHWGGWIAQLESRIEAEAEAKKVLADAVSYVAWLLLSSERIFYSLRWYLYSHSGLKDGSVFDWPYSRLIKEASAFMPADVQECTEFSVGVRHIFIHKGFPNPQEAPTKNRAMSKGFSESEIWAIRNEIRQPANFSIIKARFDLVQGWMSKSTPNVEFGI